MATSQRSLFLRLRQWCEQCSSTLLDRLERNIDSAADPEALDLPQLPTWANWSTVTIVSIFSVGLGWSIFARIDTVISVQGKLDADAQAVQSRSGGVITAVYVQEGQRVRRGQLLMQIDKTALLQKNSALRQQRFNLVKQVAVLRAARQGIPLTTFAKQGIEVSPELLEQAQTRALIVAELNGITEGLTPEQLQRLNVSQQQLETKLSAADLETLMLRSQADQSQSQVEEAGIRFDVQRQLLSQIQPLVEQGAISRTDFLKRTEDVVGVQSQLNQAQLAKSKLELNMTQSQLNRNNLITAHRQELQDQLSQLDAQANSTIVAIQRQVSDLDSQIEQIRLDLSQQDLKSPVEGVVFNLQNRIPGVVTQPGQSLLQMIPFGTLTAKVQVPNKDIAGIRSGMPVELRIDAFPSTEFGSVKSQIETIGSDVLPADNSRPGQTLFPVEIRLSQPFLARGEKQFPLTPGLSVTANIKVGTRAPIRFVADEIFKAFDRVKSIR